MTTTPHPRAIPASTTVVLITDTGREPGAFGLPGGYSTAWHAAHPEGGTLCNRKARTKGVQAVTPFVSCRKCSTIQKGS